MEDERLLTIMVTPVDVPEVVDRTRWPLHVTVIGNFRVGDARTAEVSALLASVANGISTFAVTLGPRDQFGCERDIPVLLASHPMFHRLHESLAARLRDMPGFTASEPSFWGRGYRPHATLGSAVRAGDGDTVPFKFLTLLSLRGGKGHRVSAVELS